MKRCIGLDVGTHAVRAVEVALGRGRPVLERVGQVTLPPGAVVAGEVADPPAVAEALRRLWRTVGFTSKEVVVGVANQRVITRLAELPVMPEVELRSSLRFQVQDLIPIPIDDVVLDHQVVEQVDDGDGPGRLRLLLVAAHRQMLSSLLAALEGAGLTATRIDLIPFALVRALHDDMADLAEDPAGPGPRGAEVIVGLGAGITNVVVHDRGRPRFVRSLTTGGIALTEAVAAATEVDFERAEHLKRTAGSAGADHAVVLAGQSIAPALDPILDDIRSSIDFYLTQPGGQHLERVVLTGGSSRLPGIAERLGRVLGVPVSSADPLARLARGDTGLDEGILTEAADILVVPLGLALSGEGEGRTDRRISLLPPEITAGAAARRQMVVAGGAVAATAALLVGGYLMRDGQVAAAERSADATAARTVALQGEVSSLQDIVSIEADVARREATVGAALEGEVAWSRTLQEVASVLPDDVWLTSFEGKATPTDTASPSGAIGSLTVSAMGYDQASAARWLLRVGELEAVTDLWLPSSTKSPEGESRELVTFSSDGQLTDAAASDRAARFLDGGAP
jgi:type IV pilus assembly protein PilM